MNLIRSMRRVVRPRANTTPYGPENRPERKLTKEEKLEKQRQERELWYSYSLKPYMTVVTSKHFVEEDEGATTSDDFICKPVGTNDVPNSMRIWNFQTNTHQEVEGECAICLVEYEVGDSVIQSAANEEGEHCQHVFHTECMMEWLKRGHKRCPFCRHWFVNAEPIKKQMQQAHVVTRHSLCHLYDERTMKDLVSLKGGDDDDDDDDTYNESDSMMSPSESSADA